MAIEDFSDEQVIHDRNQIRNPSELIVGESYQLMSDLLGETSSITRSVTVVSLDDIAEGFIRVRKYLPVAMLIPGIKKGTGEERISLRDTGLMPYREPASIKGKWNPHYWWLKEQ